MDLLGVVSSSRDQAAAGAEDGFMQKLGNGIRNVAGGLSDANLPPSLPPAREVGGAVEQSPRTRSTASKSASDLTTPGLKSHSEANDTAAPSTSKKYRLNTMSQSELVVLCQDLHRRVRSSKAALRDARAALGEKSSAQQESAERLQVEVAEHHATNRKLEESNRKLADTESTCRKLAAELDAVRADLHEASTELQRCHHDMALNKSKISELEQSKADLAKLVETLKEHAVSGTPDAQRLEAAEMQSAQRSAQAKGLQREMAAMARHNAALKEQVEQLQRELQSAQQQQQQQQQQQKLPPVSTPAPPPAPIVQTHSTSSASNATPQSLEAGQGHASRAALPPSDAVAIGHIRHLVLAALGGGVSPEAVPLVRAALAKALQCSAVETSKLLQS